MIPMMMMMVRPIERIKATRAWTRPGFADRNETPYSITGDECKRKSLAGDPWIDKNGDPVTMFDEMSDAEAKTHTVKLGWQDKWDIGIFEDDVCYAYLGVTTTRPSSGYEYRITFHTPGNGTWHNDPWATQYKPYRPYRSATGSIRIVKKIEESGTCTLTMIDPADGNQETMTYNVITDTEDVSKRPTMQTGNVAAHHGTVDTTKSSTLKLNGHIQEPIEQPLKVGGPTSGAYEGDNVRRCWTSSKTWTLPYWSTCYIYCTNYYGIEYSESGNKILDAVPIYDHMTQQAGFMNEADAHNRLIFSEGRRPFRPIFDDGFTIEEDAG